MIIYKKIEKFFQLLQIINYINNTKYITL
jgi:hypothetical protein